MGVIRGAICADNTTEDISAKAVELVSAIMQQNALFGDCIEAIIFTATSDLDACYPATAVRQRLGLNNTAFMCCAEMQVIDSLRGCIRVCVFVPSLSQKLCKHCYLGKAAVLRSDLNR